MKYAEACRRAEELSKIFLGMRFRVVRNDNGTSRIDVYDDMEPTSKLYEDIDWEPTPTNEVNHAG